MTPSPTPAAAPVADGQPVDDFLSTLARSNPFSHQQVTAVVARAVDVRSIHCAEFRRLTALAELVRDQNEAVGAVVWGESRSGKSNLLRRLGEWAAEGRRACLVNFLELQATPERLPRALLSTLVSALTNGFAPPWHATPLYQFVEGLIRPALPQGKQKLTPAELRKTFAAQAVAPAREAGDTPAVRATFNLLFRFLCSALLEKSRHGDGREAALAVRRLAGDSLDDEEAKALGQRPADAADPLDPAGCLHVLAALAQLARANGQPVILCFDQINNLPRQQIADVARLLHELNDRLRNVLLVLSEVRGELMKLTDAGVIVQATWDRLSAHTIELPRLAPPQGRQILEARLVAFLQPFEGVPEVNRHFKRDPLFPLGEDWFRERLGGLIDFRPRHLIVVARERWLELQQSLAGAADPRAWLDRWPNQAGGEIEKPRKPLDELIDEQIEKELADRLSRHKAAPRTLPPSADNLRGLVASLLDAGGVGLAVERPRPKSPYDLMVRWPQSDGRPESTIGLTFLSTGSANSATNTLARLMGDRKPPTRVLLVTDKRRPLAFGQAPKAQGRNHYDLLKKSASFEHLELSFEEYASLVALEAVARQASDLEVKAPVGPPRALTRGEVIASYRRRDRFRAHPLLGRLVAAPAAPAELTDAVVRPFIAGRLATTLGAASDSGSHPPP